MNDADRKADGTGAAAQDRLRAAVWAAVGTMGGMPQNAPPCPEMPRDSRNVQNKPNSPAGPAGSDLSQVSSQRNVQGDRFKHPEMPRSVPQCPTNHAKMQNKPNSPVPSRDSPPSPRALSPRQLTAISALFAGHSYTEIAMHLRIDRKTLFRWRRDPDFVAEIERRYVEQKSPRLSRGLSNAR